MKAMMNQMNKDEKLEQNGRISRITCSYIFNKARNG